MTGSSNDSNSENIELKIAYLGFIQGIISRLSNSVLILMTANITLMSALLAYCVSDNVNNPSFWIFFFPWLFLAVFHAYYLYQEKTFINIYNKAVSFNNLSISNFIIDEDTLKLNRPDFYKIFLETHSFSYFQVSLFICTLAAYFLGVK